MAVTIGDKAYGATVSGIVLLDSVNSYIKGNVEANKDVVVKSNYDKLAVNAILNIGVVPPESVAKDEGQQEPDEPDGDQPESNFDYFKRRVGEWVKDKKDWWSNLLLNPELPEDIQQRVANVDNVNVDNAQPQIDESAAYAGIISFSGVANDVKATISEGANVKAGENVNLEALSTDNVYDIGLVISANGKTGAGATVLADVFHNDVSATIENSTVNASKDINSDAKEDLTIVQASSGIAVAKDTAGAGNISSIVQANKINSAIKKSTINDSDEYTSDSQVVKLDAKNITKEIKAVGAVAIQKSDAGDGDSKAVGATLDGDVAVNEINSYIEDSSVKATKELKVLTTNDNDLYLVDVAGAGSTQGKAIAGTIAAYVAVNNQNTYIKNSTINAGAIELNSQSLFNELTINGTVAAGNRTGVGGTIRTDVICNTINSYIDSSSVVATGKVNSVNKEVTEQIAVSVAGAGSTKEGASSGVISVLASVSDQNNYINNSTVASGSVALDTERTMYNVAVTGAIAASVGNAGTSIGASAYSVGVGHHINTYIKNSDIDSNEDISLTSKYTQDSYNVIFGGAGGKGFSGSGAVSVLANNSDINTYALAEKTQDKKKLTSKNGAVSLHSTTDIDTVTVDGNVSVSTNSVSAGGAINTTVYDSDITAGIDGAEVNAKKGVDILAKADQDHISTVIGASVSTGGMSSSAYEGSADTLVMSQNMESYIKNSTVKSGGDVSVVTDDDLSLVSVAGALAVSGGTGNSVGASILTVTMTGEDKAKILNSTFDDFDSTSKLGALLVKSTQTDDFRGATLAGSVGFLGIGGSIDTIVLNKTIEAVVEGLTNINDSEFNNAEVNAHSHSYLGHGTGQVSASANGVGVGASVSTLVLNKDVNAIIKNSVLNSKDYIKNLSDADIDILSVVLGFGGGSSASINGTVATQVLNVDVLSNIENSTLSAANDIINQAITDNDLDTYIASVNGSKEVAVGGVIYSLVDNSTAKTFIKNNSKIKKAKTLSNYGKIDSDYLATMFNASIAGETAANGNVSTFVLNADAESGVENSSVENVGNTSVHSENIADTDIIMLQATGSGEAAVNAGVNTIVSSKKSKAKVKDSKVSSTGDIGVKADANNNIDVTVVSGAGSGELAATGSINTIVSSDTIEANVAGSELSTTVANDKNKDTGITVSANDTLNVVGHTGAAAGSGSAAVGGAIVTGVVVNDVKSIVENSDLTSENADIIISSIANETIGDAQNPFITIAASGSGGTSVSGAVDTLVLSSSSIAKVNGKKTNGLRANDKLQIKGEGNTTLLLSAGIGAAGATSVGGTISTLVIDKEIQAIADKTVLDSLYIDVNALSTDNITNIIVAGAFAASAAVTGVINTTVIGSDLDAGITNSTVYSNDVDVTSKANANYENTTGAVAGSGSVGVGASVVTNVVGYDSSAYISDSTVSKSKTNRQRTNRINIDASADTDYTLYAISGGIAAEVGVAGVIETNVVNNSVTAYATGDIYANTIDVKAKDTVDFYGLAGNLAAGSVAGVGATIQTNSVTSTVLSYIGGQNINANDIDVNSEGIQNFNGLAAIGFGGGSVAVDGTSLVNLVDATVKAYVVKGSKITSNSDFDVIAKNTTTITEWVGTGAVAKYAAAAASIGVNKITNTVEAFTQDNVTLVTSAADFNATSTTNLGKKGDELSIVAGSVAAGGSLAGAVLVNTVENKTAAYLGNKNNVNNTQALNLTAKDDTFVYETVGALGVAGVVGIGASVGVNSIKNTVITYIGTNSVIEATGNIGLNAISNETIVADANVVGGGAIALSGGVLHNTIGENVSNASSNDLTGDDAQNYNTAKKQADEVLVASADYKAASDNTFKQYFNAASNDASVSISNANNNINSTLSQTEPNTTVSVSANNVKEKETTFSLFTKSRNSGSSIASTNRDKTTSAFIDTAAQIKAKDVVVSAIDTNNVKMTVDGNTYGAAAVGVSAAVSNVNTTTNAFLSNNVVVESSGKVDVKATSSDTQNLTVEAASGGIVSGSGAVSKINSNKITNAYILKNSLLDVAKDIEIQAKSNGVITSTVVSGSYGGVNVGVSVADAIIKGETRVDLGEDVTLSSKEGNISIIADENEKATSDATATAGSLVGGSGAEANSQTGKNNKIDIGKNVNIYTKLTALVKSVAKNESIAKTNGRAYGGISAGGTKTNSNVVHNGGVKIADADSDANKSLLAKFINIMSTSDNNVSVETKAGAGAALGVSGSGVYTNINSNNNVYVGKNYKVSTTGDVYSVAANNKNTYKAYNDSSAYGVVGVTAGIIENTVNSTVNVTSNANVDTKGIIEVVAINNVTKDAVSNYDLYGGAGGVIGVGAASLADNITMATNANLGGDYAYSTGKYGNGHIDVLSQSVLDVTEKVDVTAGGAVPVADGNVKIISTVNTKTQISNKDVKTSDDDINYIADNDVSIYTKSNVSSYGGVAVADGKSYAQNNKGTTSVIIDSGVNSISGRSTNVQASATKDIQAYMYAVTKGLIGAVGNSKAEAYNSNSSEISVAKGASIKSYDSMNLTAVNKTSKIHAERSAKGTTYIVFGIPITIYGKGNQCTKNDSNATITLNGSLESGLGANKTLTINKDGSYDSNGVNVVGKEKVGEITNADIDSNIEAYEKSKEGELNQVDDYIIVEKNVIEEANKEIKKYEVERKDLGNQNETYRAAIDNAYDIIDNNNSINNIDSVTSVWNSAFSSTSTESGTTYSLDESFGTELNKYLADSHITDVIAKYQTYNNDKSDANIVALKTAVENLAGAKTVIQSENSSLSTKITNINSNVDCSNNTQLDLFIEATTDKINTNESSISNYSSSILSLQNSIEAANDEIQSADTLKNEITAKYDKIIADLNQQKIIAAEAAIPVYSLILDDIYVRSGDTNINGNVVGNGTITAPGDKFTVNIINNSVSDIVYNDIKIGRNVTGGITGLGNNSTITKTILNQSPEYKISIENTVDANDPTINLSNGYGDMVFKGDIENTKGLVRFVNNTGNILSEGSITAKDLKISVPNGGYTQNYADNTVMIGGSSGNGAITASGNIDIASKIIDVNGLIQSGSEIKSVTIPKFTVVKEGDKYYQVVDGVRSEMQQGATDGYYYMNLAGNGQLDSELELIKAYFKPSDISNVNNVEGDIYLFKADIEGGNITLTGNIISSSNNGKIVLINGYGHIDVVNNSSHNLVTSALNADANVQGKLTINDFKLSDTDKAGTSFDKLTQKDVENSTWLKQHAGTYTAQVDDSGKIVTTTSGQTSGNGSWASTQTSSMREDGAKINTITYNPGEDAYIVTKSGSTETKSYTVYVERSWWTEFWHGKLYRTVYYTVEHSPEYGVAKNPINIQFQGFDTPQINITSNGSIVMNSNASALTGNINLVSKEGNITTNSINNIISAENIGLSATNGNVGSDLRPIQAAIFNNGTLSSKGKDIFINYPYSDISNIDLQASGNAYLATSGAKLGGLNSVINISAGDTLELRAGNGSIDLDSSKNNNINISVNKLKARAKDDIAITNKNDLKISSIVSTSQGAITLGSENGSIIAEAVESLNPYHINGGDVILKALNGYIGTNSDPVKIARDGIYRVESKNDINISSVGRIHTDLIKSTEGGVNLNADYGIISSKSGDNLVYNIYSATGVDLNSKHGNIENIVINTDGIINASAGYTDGIASGMSDISISLMSKEELAQESLESLSADERQQAYNEYTTGLKDMKVGTIRASKNVSLSSEKSIQNANNNSLILGEQIILSAGFGDVGASESAIKLTANRDITAFAGNNRSIYLASDNDLKVNEIRSFKATDSTVEEGALAKVVLSTAGNIFNSAAEADKINISANNISLNAGKDIGSAINYFTVDTKSTSLNDGLEYQADNAYIKGLGQNLNIISSDVVNSTNIISGEDTSVVIQNSKAGEKLNVNSFKNTTFMSDNEAKSITINSKEKTELTNTKITGDLNNTSNTLVVEDAKLENIITQSETAKIINMTVADSANITTTGNTTIAKANVKGDFTNTSANTEVTEKLSVEGNAEITANELIKIADANMKKDLGLNSKNITIDEMSLKGNINANANNVNISSTNDINIGNISGKDEVYANDVKITSGSSIYNGNSDDGVNLYAKNIDLKANKNIGKEEKPMSIMLAKGNKISMTSNGSIAVSTNGAGANYSKIETDRFVLDTDSDIEMETIKVNNMKLKTTSSNLSVDNMEIGNRAVLDVGKKRIVVDNSSLRPIIDADVQMYLTQSPAKIRVDGSDNIIADKINITRHDEKISINNDSNSSSMNDVINASVAAGIKNTKVAEKTIEKTEALIYKIPTEKSYNDKIVNPNDKGVIMNNIEEVVTPENAFDIINISEYRQHIKDKQISKLFRRNSNNKISSL